MTTIAPIIREIDIPIEDKPIPVNIPNIEQPEKEPVKVKTA
jgi:hypothetical protein